MPRQPLSQRSENAMDGQGGGGGEALMAKVKAAASDQGVREMKEVGGHACAKMLLDNFLRPLRCFVCLCYVWYGMLLSTAALLGATCSRGCICWRTSAVCRVLYPLSLHCSAMAF